MRRCSKCGKPGHNAATCGKVKEVKNLAHVGKRRCGLCGQLGHNARTCPNKNKTETQINSEESRLRAKEEAHRLLQQQRQKKERIPINDIVPKKGYWIVNVDKKKVAGRISYFKKSGEVVWEDTLGTFIATEQIKFINNGYEYVSAFEPYMLRWEVVGV